MRSPQPMISSSVMQSTGNISKSFMTQPPNGGFANTTSKKEMGSGILFAYHAHAHFHTP
jgi:hypothetical protein